MNNIKITDEHWKLFSQYLTRNNKSKAGRPQHIDKRLVFEEVLYILTTGIPWRFLPKEYRTWQTVYKLFADRLNLEHWKNFCKLLEREYR